MAFTHPASPGFEIEKRDITCMSPVSHGSQCVLSLAVKGRVNSWTP